MDQEYFMNYAYQQALKAYKNGEVPVGAILVNNGKIIAKSFNSQIKKNDPSAHAEINVLRYAGKKINNYRLVDSTLYVTLEPCIMCFGAIIHARIKELVFGAYDSKIGVISSQKSLLDSKTFNHSIEITGGVMKNECGALIKEFFLNKRN